MPRFQTRLRTASVLGAVTLTACTATEPVPVNAPNSVPAAHQATPLPPWQLSPPIRRLLASLPPSNDNLTSAQVINGLPQTFLDNRDVTGATTETTLSLGCPTTSDVWYRFVPTESFRLFVGTEGSDYDVSVGLYRDHGDFIETLGCNDFLQGGNQPREVAGSVEGGATYLLNVSTLNAGAPGQLVLTIRGPRLAPTGIVTVTSISIDSKAGSGVARGTASMSQAGLIFGGLSIRQKAGRGVATGGVDVFLEMTEPNVVVNWVRPVTFAPGTLAPGQVTVQGTLLLTNFESENSLPVNTPAKITRKP